MSRAWEKTIALLAATPNEAAVPILAASLEESAPDLAAAALRALLERPADAEGTARRAILARWHKLPAAIHDLVIGQEPKLEAAMREALHHDDFQQFSNACALAKRTDACDLIPQMTLAAEDSNSRRAGLACHTLLLLADRLDELCHAPRDYGDRRDPHVIRQAIIGSLESAAQRFYLHGKLEIVDAFLVLANRENPTLKRILQSPGDRLYKILGEVLQKSVRPGIVRLLASFFNDPQAPLITLTAISRRRDEPMLRELLRRAAAEWKPAALSHLKRLDALPSLELAIDNVPKFPPEEQKAAIQLASSSNIPRPQVFLLAEKLLKRGAPIARAAAVVALGEFSIPLADQWIAQLVHDSDPDVQAQAIRQLRPRKLPGAMTLLVELLDSEHEVVREAARESLHEFQFPRYFELFPNLGPTAKRQTGQLVHKVDPRFGQQLRAELHSTVRHRREAALEIVAVLGITAEFTDELIRLTNDDDELIRIAALEALATCDSAPAQTALRDRLIDSSPRVRHVAEHALQWQAEGAQIEKVAGQSPRVTFNPTPAPMMPIAWETFS